MTRPVLSLLTLTGLLFLAGCASSAPGEALPNDLSYRAKSNQKVQICHVTSGSNGYVLIEVSENALDAHLDHGDYLPSTLYDDTDGDGRGDPASEAVVSCEAIDGMVDNDDDLCPTEDATGFDADNDGCLDDTDGDGLTDDADACPTEDATGFDADNDGCLDDTDGDGLTDDADACPTEDATGFDADNDGCVDDSDGDGVTDDLDLCPAEDATDYDADGDGCIDDSDGDGVTDDVDACPEEDATGDDMDGDGCPDGCGASDFSGSWTLDTPVSYRCGYFWFMYMVDVDVSQVTIVDGYPSITVSNGSQPGTMTGSYSSSIDFQAENLIPGTCDESYTISGSFISDDTLQGTFEADFQGSSCLDCTLQSWSFTATRTLDGC